MEAGPHTVVYDSNNMDEDESLGLDVSNIVAFLQYSSKQEELYKNVLFLYVTDYIQG